MNQLLQGLFDGVALGAQYSVIVVGFVVIYRATGIINFAQGGFVLIGAYVTYNISQTWGWNFYLALLMSMLVTAAISIVMQRILLQWVLREVVGMALWLVLWALLYFNGWGHAPAVAVSLLVGLVGFGVTRRIEQHRGSGQARELPIFGSIMVTIGLLYVIKQVVPSIWGFAELNMGDPWGLNVTRVGGLVLSHAKLWTIGLTVTALVAFFAVNRYTKIGVAMRATHFDHEAAVAQGISLKVVFAVAFGIAGAVAALAGTTAGAGIAQLTTNLDLIVFLAFPAMILGGFDSPGGAVLGGIIIGVVQNLTKVYQPEWDLNWLGVGFDRVTVYIVMLIVLMIRPYGLFGTREVHRV
ncbi:MAG: branched-chain amino acid ABC transporter permease [Actinobacteria bacterium]|nr:branched-chain amino acid ABC transporter permease [Actinomycetota bacterium]MBL6925531.1 branched-chain amino acid ABC transporter permease [Acidimicrobiia bacterium]